MILIKGLKMMKQSRLVWTPDLINIGQGKNSLISCQNDSLFDSEL